MMKTRIVIYAVLMTIYTITWLMDRSSWLLFPIAIMAVCTIASARLYQSQRKMSRRSKSK